MPVRATSGGGGANSVIETREVTAPANQIDFTDIEGDFIEIRFWAEITAGKILQMQVNDDATLANYSVQFLNGENGAAVATEDDSESGIHLSRNSSGDESISGKITIMKNGQIGTQNAIHVRVETQTLNATTAKYNNSVAGFIFNNVSINKISIGCRGWFISGIATEFVTAGEFRLTQAA